MRRVRVSSHQSPVHKLGDDEMKLTPKFRVASAPVAAAPLAVDSERGLCVQPLIPGLPDDVALNCLLRLPVKDHLSARLVSRRWHQLLARKARFFTERKALGLCTPWLFTLAFHRGTGKIQWQVMDLEHMCWHAIPAMPCRDRVCPRGFGCIAIPSEGALLVCGGLLSDIDSALHLVLKYDVFKNRWTVMSRMITARSFFASGVIDGRVYVAGGYCADQFELNSAEVLDPADGSWQPVAGMGINMASSDSAVVDNKLYLTEGCAWPFFSSPRGQVYDPRTDSWEAMAFGMREGWTGQSFVMDGHLFVISEFEKLKLKVYHMDTDSWDAVLGAPMPARIRKPLSVSCLGDRVIVVGRGLHVATGYVTKRECSSSEKKAGYSVQWGEVEAPGEYADLTPSSSQILNA